MNDIHCKLCGYLNGSLHSDICETCFLQQKAVKNGGCTKFVLNPQIPPARIMCGLTVRGKIVLCEECKQNGKA